MNAMPWLPLVARALATALIVVSASMAAETFGAAWGALIASLPVSVGPTYVFLAMQHGPDFVATSALNSAAANAATGFFLITYGVLARRMPSGCSLGTAIGGWLVASLVVQQIAWTPVSAGAVNLVVYGPGLIFLNRTGAADPGPARPSRRRWFDLPSRAASVAAFVSLVVAVSTVLGPTATGVAAVFPISLTSLIVILLPRLGGPATARVATNALPPMLGFGGMFLTLHLTIRPLGVWTALGLALAFCALWSGFLLPLQTGVRYGRIRNPPNSAEAGTSSE